MHTQQAFLAVLRDAREYRRLRARVRGWFRIPSEYLDDVLQTAVLRYLGAADRYTGPDDDNMAIFLAICRNEFLEVLRRQKLEEARLGALVQVTQARCHPLKVGVTQDPATDLAYADTLRVVTEAIARLPYPSREAINCHIACDGDYALAAMAAGQGPNTFKSALFRARVRLQSNTAVVRELSL